VKSSEWRRSRRTFTEGDWLTVHATVAAVRRHTPDTYNLYLSDRRVASAIVDALLGPEDGFQPPQMSFRGSRSCSAGAVIPSSGAPATGHGR